mmetsp:Transcript_133896/g.244207  ORF Transcript_133896/g.244207 Transcript_133896/m.244207 type:complete len:210 (-) Transcript_133896:412-1041(-)
MESLSPSARAAASRSRSAAKRSNSVVRALKSALLAASASRGRSCKNLSSSSASPAVLAFASSSSRLRVSRFSACVRASAWPTRFSREVAKSWDKLFAKASVNSLISWRSACALSRPCLMESRQISSPFARSAISCSRPFLRVCNSVFVAPSAKIGRRFINFSSNSLSPLIRSVVSRSSSFFMEPTSLLLANSAKMARNCPNFSSTALSV